MIRNEDERLQQYVESIRSILDSQAFDKIIFCENSNYGTERLSDLINIAKEKGTELELLSFQGNEEKACIHGKGYGEGEIMHYVFAHSSFINSEIYFVKLTGRLKVDNIQAIASRLKQHKTYFNIPNHTRRDIYDTRIYAMPIKQFEDLFLESFEQVMDDQGIFLEVVYTDILRKCNVRVSNFPKYPRIVGISGSGGIAYTYTEWKCRIKDVLSKIGFYKIKG